MTHQNFQTNGASLEDCHTNFFALTELSGIKWRKLVCVECGGGGGGGPGEILEDPVLRSYARCLASDILCVWRRVSAPPPSTNPFDMGPPPPQQPPPLSLAAPKELWIFWYGEEPDLQALVAPELLTPDSEQGSWESGLSYECRSLLFKALHNLIERCLLSRDFVRLGKWFVQPYDGPKKPSEPSATHLSFSFAFFIHGENTVCASVDVRQHPPVRRLTRWHLQQAQASTSGLQVILAPFGLAGSLTGQAYKSAESTVRFLEEWSQFYPVDKNNAVAESTIVEVLVAGIKMRYPLCYVLVTDMDEETNKQPVLPSSPPTVANTGITKTGSSTPIIIHTPPPSPVQINSKVPQPGPYPVSVEHINTMQKCPTAANMLPERVWQECILGGPPGTNGANENNGTWDFVDPLQKNTCACSKCRKLVSSMTVSKWTTNCSSGKGNAPRLPKGGRGGRIPFHRRSPDSDASRCPLPGSYTPQEGGPPSYPRTQESMAIPSVGSQASAPPSPLANPHSQQPSSVTAADQNLPTMSPHVTSLSTQSPADKTETPDHLPTSTGSVLNSPMTGPGADTKPDVNSQSTTSSLSLLKRPILSSKDYEATLGEEEHSLDLLYDYSTLDAWLNHPIKRFKPDEKDIRRTMYAKNIDLYTMFSNNGVSNNTNADQNNPNVAKQTPFIKQEITETQGDGENQHSMQSPLPHGVKRPGDPYEFEEDDGFNKRAAVGVKEEPKDKKVTTGNLLTLEGLQPSYKDLENLFDDNDDTSSDEATQAHTTPGSNTSAGHHDENQRLSGQSSSGCSTIGILSSSELCKMFPTPPSLEHNPMPSPIGQIDLPPPDFTDLTIIRVKQEIYPNLGSPPEENIEDWSYVFKPPTVCKMVGSSKYAPLTNLPSQNLPPVSLPSNCVYKPSWLQHSEKTIATNHNTNNTAPVQSAPQSQPSPQVNNTPTPTPNTNVHPVNTFPQSPANFRPPPPYELPSPATSTTSSYHNKNLNSVEPVSTPSVQKTPEASSLMVNVLLSDTALNIFRDHNFDSCTLCVCNAGPKVVGNIRGADAGVYLLNSVSGERTSNSAVQAPNSPFMNLGQPPPYGGLLSPTHPQPEEDSITCNCGFSAVVNRRLSHHSGLFYEDEMEITGIAEDPGERKKSSLVSFLLSISTTKMDPSIERDQLETIPYGILELIREQCVMIQSTANSIYRAAYLNNNETNPPYFTTVHVLEYADGNEVTTLALEQSKQSETMSICKVEENQRSSKTHSLAVHQWPYLRACGPPSNQDIVRVMKSLLPFLQEAIQKRSPTRMWDAPSAVNGPLTWRQFHRQAGRGTEDRCEPQPIPSIVVGHEKDWLSLSPYAIQHWESLLLEPYSYTRDVAYIVVAPDNDAILPRVRTFFKELSTAYEMCKLGRHCPITKVLTDGGILRVGKNAKAAIGNEPVEEWFTLLGEGEVLDMIKLYAQVCKHRLAPHLQTVPMDKTLLDPPTDPVDKPAPSPMPPPSTPDNNSGSTSGMPPSSQIPGSGSTAGSENKAPSTPKNDQEGDQSKESTSVAPPPIEISHDEEENETPSVVVYLVDPFSMGSDQPELQRLACLALLRCFQTVLLALPENVRSNISVQIISQESIVELGRALDRARHSDHMRSLALSIFSQCRRQLVHTNNVKSLTGFGTAAMADLFLKSKDEKNRAPYKMYTPPYILAPLKDRQDNAESFGQGSADQATVLYLSYCLSEDQSWLLATCTDERGEIFETCTINIDIPNRSRRKKASARRVGLEKLMEFILGVMSQSVKAWRLVVGRLGRIGHGELKGWSHLLSKKYLLKASKKLKEICQQCSLMYPNNVPCIMSACLVSLEADSALRVMSDQFTPDERFSQVSVNSQLSTPQDVTCTHILVFPTSATTQSSQTAFQEQHINEPALSEELADFLQDNMEEGIDDFSDIFNWTSNAGGGHSPTGSPRREESRPGSPSFGNNTGRQGSQFPCANNSRNSEPAEEVGMLLQQPLALGYLVSTAPTGRMPKWFWASCPHLEGVCPTFLKNALHLHSPTIQQSSDDLLQQAAVTSHPLDSQFTTDVLRYVLEGYNALSWLVLDSNTKDRLACLPVHMQVLIQLYHATAALT